MAWSILPRIWYSIRDVPIHIPVQDIALTGLNTSDVRIADLKGKVLVLDFWNTVCAACYLSKPKVQALAQKYKDNPKVLIASVSSAHYDSLNAVKKSDYLEIGESNSIAEYYDHTGELIRRIYGNGCPVVAFVNPDGVATLTHHAYDTDTRRLYGHLLDLQIQEMLATQQ